jgi:hypothetical protein
MSLAGEGSLPHSGRAALGLWSAGSVSCKRRVGVLRGFEFLLPTQSGIAQSSDRFIVWDTIERKSHPRHAIAVLS